MSDESTERARMSALDCSYFDGLLGAFDDLPDGAYQAAYEEVIRWSEENCVDHPRAQRGRDPNDVWIDWMLADSEDGSVK